MPPSTLCVVGTRLMSIKERGMKGRKREKVGGGKQREEDATVSCIMGTKWRSQSMSVHSMRNQMHFVEPPVQYCCLCVISVRLMPLLYFWSSLFFFFFVQFGHITAKSLSLLLR